MKKNRFALNDQSGFTILELLIASLIFTVILLITTLGIIQITRSYIRGSVSSEIQNTNRSIVDQITQQIKLSSTSGVTIPQGPGYPTIWNSNTTYWFCVNGIRYIYQYNNTQPYALSQDNHGIACQSPSVDPPSAASGVKSLLSANTQILQPVGEPGGGINMVYQVNKAVTPSLYGVTLDLLYGTPGSYHANTYLCDSISQGGAFCDNSTITTAVGIRNPSDF